MATTFDINISTEKDRARSLLGDTGQDLGAWLLQDETIQGFLDKLPFSEAVAQLAMGLATRYARQPSWYEDEGGTRMKWEDRKQAWWTLAQEVRTSTTPEDLNYIGGQYQVADLPLPCPAKKSPYGTPGMRTGAEGMGRRY